MGLRTTIFGSVYAAVNLTPNTFIGGLASAIPTKAALATKLGIAESSIGYFGVNGNNIEAAVNVSYNMPINVFFNNDIITSFEEVGNVTSINQSMFGDSGSIARVILPICTNINGEFNFQATNSLKRLYIPNVTDIGMSAGNNRNFRFGSFSNCNIYANEFLETNNAGAMDGDLADAQFLGATIKFIRNLTKPSSITDLSHSGGTLAFTAPISANTLDFYEVYVNGFYKQEIAGSGSVISGLVNGDKVTVYACDIYYNRSLSNEITISGL